MTNPQRLACASVWGGNEAIEADFVAGCLDSWVYSRPFGGVSAGGDVYFLSLCNQGRLCRYCLADVAGHGDRVAEAATRVRDVMTRTVDTPDQTEFIRAINVDLVRNDTSGLFTTLVAVGFDATSDEIIVTNAGHPSPAFYSSRNRRWLFVEDAPALAISATGVPLGVVGETTYTQAAHRFDAGDALVLYTDGLVEARNPEGREFGSEGLLRILDALGPPTSARDLGHGILDGLTSFLDGRELRDDVTVIVVHRSEHENSATIDNQQR